MFDYLEKNYKELYNLITEIDKNIFISPHEVLIKGRVYGEKISAEIAKKEGLNHLNDFMSFAERLKGLNFANVLEKEIINYFYDIRTIGNQAAHGFLEDELMLALKMHKCIFKITGWFIETYIDYNFETPMYKNPLPTKESNIENNEILNKLMEKVEKIYTSNEVNRENPYKEIALTSTFNNEKIPKIEIKEIDKGCLIQSLNKLKESSKEAVEGLNSFSDFKKYMHITRYAQNELEDLIMKSNESDKGQLILVCGSVGDGKSHIISYFKDKYPHIISNFTLHNDATESLEPTKTSMDTLNDILDNFSDEKIYTTSEKFILAINLGTLNNFIDSEYGDRFTKLREFVFEKKILEQSIEENHFNEENNFQFINFSDYHLFTLKNGKVKSKYVNTLINRITENTDNNPFYNSYKKNCSQCSIANICPIKANYELLGKEEVQESIIDLLVQSIIKNKIIISTRALLNFMYELLVARSYIDINSPMFKRNISKLNKIEYIKSLTPNIIFDHKELSFIFETLNTLDPLNVRNDGVDKFIIEFNNSEDLLSYFTDYINYPKGYLNKMDDFKIGETEDKGIKSELLKLFIRSYYILGDESFISLEDETYKKFMTNLYYWNKGERSNLKELYIEVKNGIINWNGEADKNNINIFLGQNQIKYKISEELELKADLSNLKVNRETELVKFLTKMNLAFKTDKNNINNSIEIDYTLYNLLNKVANGYRPNKKDKNQFIKFIEYISKLEEIGSQNEKIVFTEKNRENNKKYKLEYNDEFEEYRFMEM